MAKYLGRPVTLLQSLYRFVGGETFSRELDVEAPINMVHDVGEMAERFGGVYLLNAFSATTAGAGVAVFSVRDVSNFFASSSPAASALQTLNLTPENADVWLVEVTARATANLGRAACASVAPQNERFANALGPVTVTTEGSLVFDGATTRPGTQAGGLGHVVRSDSVAGGGLVSARAQSSIKLPAQTVSLKFVTQDDATGALTVTWLPLLWICPRGGRPPAR